jgi:endonuclease/exonuclease/phosphatase (EEP) superfamily protein YafD
VQRRFRADRPVSGEGARPRGRRTRPRRGPALVAWLSLACLALPLTVPAWRGLPPVAAWLLDLATHWQWLFAVVLLLALLSLALRSRRRWLVLLLVLPAPWLTAVPAAPSGEGDSVTLASINVGYRNADPQLLADWLRETRADVVVLLEASPGFSDRLVALGGYGARVEAAGSGLFNIAVVSRFALRDTRVVRDDNGIPRLETRVGPPDRAFALAAVHPMPPLTPVYHAASVQQLEDAAAALARSPLPAVLAGDFNATPWSLAPRNLAKHGLRRASGLQPTWPAIFGGWFGIPIDQVMVSDGWQVVERAVGHDIGSDHLPVMVRLRYVGQPG